MSVQVPGLEPFRGSLEEIYANFNKYKRTVPVRCGPGARTAAARPAGCCGHSNVLGWVGHACMLSAPWRRAPLRSAPLGRRAAASIAAGTAWRVAPTLAALLPLRRGAILLTPDCTKCLLVRGYKKDAGWGFPRGKLSKDETDAQCAVREVRRGQAAAAGCLDTVWRGAGGTAARLLWAGFAVAQNSLNLPTVPCATLCCCRCWRRRGWTLAAGCGSPTSSMCS